MDAQKNQKKIPALGIEPSVRAIGIGSFKGGKFASGASSNTENSSSSSSDSSSCNVCNTCLSSNADNYSDLSAKVDVSSNSVSSNAGSASNACSLTNARSSSNSGLISNTAGVNAGSCSGGSFIVNSYGPVAPSGISVSAYSDLIGDLAVSGQLPFLSAVAFDGAFQNTGKASVAYGCGDGNIAIQEIIGAKPGSCGYIL
ncbi:hypothetical protein MSG28_014986 [Choristoneura fumiferana]|uniref:Uncharacterized protein n=1 Tax=Choristoneura fumiferana TaxID=7141 RepID=A0ACC0KYF4_CHOFU|nr:hypothetical protein MSG28_014986 [Choristoneura fumiferana]